MPVSTTNALSGPLNTNGVTTDFPFTFTAPSASEVGVLLRNTTTLAETVVSSADYTVTLGESSGGTVAFSVAPADGQQVFIFLNPSFTQGVLFQTGGAMLAQFFNSVADQSVARDQALARDVARAPLVKMGEEAPSFPLLSVLAGQPITLTGNAEVGYAFAPFSLEPAVGASLAFSDLQGPRSQAVIYNPDGVAEGGYPVEFSAQETTAFVRAYAKVFGGDGTCTITIQDNQGVQLWQKTGVSSSATDEVVSVSLLVGRDLIVVVSEISGTVTGVVAKMEGAIA